MWSWSLYPLEPREHGKISQGFKEGSLLIGCHWATDVAVCFEGWLKIHFSRKVSRSASNSLQWLCEIKCQLRPKGSEGGLLQLTGVLTNYLYPLAIRTRTHNLHFGVSFPQTFSTTLPFPDCLLFFHFSGLQRGSEAASLLRRVLQHKALFSSLNATIKTDCITPLKGQSSTEEDYRRQSWRRWGSLWEGWGWKGSRASSSEEQLILGVLEKSQKAD